MSFREWPGSRIVFLSIGWVLACLAFWYWLMSKLMSEMIERSPGIGAVSMSLLEPVAVLFGPPLVLGLLWLALRRRPE